MKMFEAPEEDLPQQPAKTNKRKAKEAEKEKKHDSAKKPDIDDLKKKFLKRK